jgi:hypothetical protein
MKTNKTTQRKKTFKKNLGKTKAQGAIEYLLIIGAAILVVAIVIIAVANLTTEGAQKLDDETIRETSLILECQKECLTNNGKWTGNTCTGHTFELDSDCQKAFQKEYFKNNKK